jgi:arylsulfatase A-like enzyme
MDRVLGAVDLLPTVLGLLGVEGPREVQGADASVCATGGARAHCGAISHWERAGVKVRHAWDDAAFFHHSHFDLAGVFTPDYELALWRSGEGALFSRRNDPEQLRNLFDEPDYAAVRRELRDRVVAHNRAIGSPAAAWLMFGKPGASKVE